MIQRRSQPLALACTVSSRKNGAIPGMLAMASARCAFQLRAETPRRSANTGESGATARCSSTDIEPVLASLFRTFRTVFLKRFERQRGGRQAIERHHIPIASGCEVRHDGLDDGLRTANDEPVRERGVGSVQHAHEAHRQTVKRAAPMDERDQRNGARAVFDEKDFGPTGGRGDAPAAAEPLVTEKRRRLPALRGHSVPHRRQSLEAIERVEPSHFHALTPASRPSVTLRRWARPLTDAAMTWPSRPAAEAAE